MTSALEKPLLRVSEEGGQLQGTEGSLSSALSVVRYRSGGDLGLPATGASLGTKELRALAGTAATARTPACCGSCCVSTRGVPVPPEPAAPQREARVGCGVLGVTHPPASRSPQRVVPAGVTRDAAARTAGLQAGGASAACLRGTLGSHRRACGPSCHLPGFAFPERRNGEATPEPRRGALRNVQWLSPRSLSGGWGPAEAAVVLSLLS